MAQTAAVRRGTDRLSARLGIALAAVAALLSTSVPGVGRAPSSGPAISVLVREVVPASNAAERLVAAVGGKVTSELPIVGGFAARVPANTVGALQSVRNVVSEVVSSGLVRFDGSYGANSGVASAVYPTVVGADKDWRYGWTGSGVGVAVIDTGVSQVGDLAGHVVHSEDFSGEGDGVDRFGHGTFIGGLIAGSGAGSAGQVRGVAPGANIISLKIAGASGAADITHVMAALQWAVTFKDTYNIRVINLSLGTDSTQDYRIDPLNQAVERAWQAGIVVVVSAGNHGPAASTISKPADDPFVITVGATNDHTTTRTNDDTVGNFSSAGPTTSNGLTKPDIVAPGASLVSTRAPGSTADVNHPEARIGTQYFKGSGTSFSAGVVSGTAALILDRDPSLTPDQVKARMMDTARAGSVTDPNRVGAGSLDAFAATVSNSTRAANQGVQASDGSGSLQLSRGTLSVSIPTGSTVDVTTGGLVPVYTPVTGPLTAQNMVFNAVNYACDWNGSTWGSSQWMGSTWGGSTWGGSTWGGSTWGGSTWGGSTWGGSTWGGADWYGSTWGGS
ncbi:MAG: Serine protease AprX, partial [Frankiales bacterium]|nr:Serine protease AprX [Frankiales bacterium]